MVDGKAIEQLSIQPRILAQILDGLHRESDSVDIAKLIRQDSIATSLLLSATSASDNHNIERALELLGENQFRALFVSHGFRQLAYPSVEKSSADIQIQFWKSSLACAHFARAIAILTNYHSPEEAYLSGLVANLGQSVLLENHNNAYIKLLKNEPCPKHQAETEQQLLNQDHSNIAADIVSDWHLSGFMADAIRYQHEPCSQIQDAHHLVKIIHCATLAADTGKLKQELVDDAKQLFGLNEELTRELYSKNVSDVDRSASRLKITVENSYSDALFEVGQRLAELSELSQLNSELLAADNHVSLTATIDQYLHRYFGISRSVLLLCDETRCLLFTHNENTIARADFKILLESGRSLTADCLLEMTPMQSDDHRKLTVIDRQLLNFCGGEILVCRPLRHREKNIGVLVLAVDHDGGKQISEKNRFLKKLCKQIAQSMAMQRNDSSLASNTNDSSSASYHHKINEAVHEASNPLSIIHNYLEVLRIELGDEHEANTSLALIKEEIERVGGILNELKEPHGIETARKQATQSTFNISRVIEDAAQIIKESICVTKGLTLELNIDNTLTEFQGSPNPLKQILTNLLKNSVEVLPEGGQIHISSDNHASFSGLDCVLISVRDNGTGLPEEIKRTLFNPVTSNNDRNYSGLGLNIVKKLVDTMNGHIVCHSNANTGTEFQILLPKTLVDFNKENPRNCENQGWLFNTLPCPVL
ncbi:MAG: signal transduction histidine kinase/HD-like signal output (HDOD) protein [Gammaproteobacteria bacterium]|jgi:signal transduction histidine kinase/HD-like signal output (HDOD) protein